MCWTVGGLTAEDQATVERWTASTAFESYFGIPRGAQDVVR